MKSLFGGGVTTRASTAVAIRSNPFENPAVPLTSVSLLSVLGGSPTDAGVSVSEENAFSVATFWRCANVEAGLIAGFPLHVFARKDRSPVVAPALTAPLTGTPFEQWETIALHLLVWGNAYVQKIRNASGQVIDLQPIYPSRVRVVLFEGQKLFFVTSNEGTVNAHKPLTNFDIMHIPGPSIDGIRGMGVVEHARQSLGTTMAADMLAAKQFGNGALLAGMLTTEQVLKEDQAVGLKQRWRDTLAGVAHAHDIFVGGAGTKFVPMSMSNEDAQFLASREWNALEICRWFGLPPHLAMLVDKSTSWGTGIEQQNIGLLKFTIQQWLTRIEQRVTLEIIDPATQYAEFETDNLLRADTVTRYQAYQFALLNGWMTRNEVRVKENLTPLEGLDVPLVPTVAPPMLSPAGPEAIDPDATGDNGVVTDPDGA